MQVQSPSNLPHFTDASVLVLGDVMLDRYWFGETSRVSPEAPVPIVKINNLDNRPGGAGNVALNLAALGAKVTLVGMVGNDEAAKIMREQLSAAGVDHALFSNHDIATIIKLRVISRQQQLLRLDFEESCQTTAGAELIDLFKKHLTNAKLVILSDYNKGTLNDPQIFIRLAREANVKVLVDPKNLDFSVYRHADIITPNYKEFESIVGPCANEAEIVEKGRQLLTKYQFKALLITRGQNGMSLIQADSVHHLPAYARTVYDVTGAGDTVIATLGASVAAGASLYEAINVANLAASLVVGKLGAVTVTTSELQAALTGKTSHQQGVLSEADVLQAIKEVRTQGKKIVFTNGCFDILHAGHVAYLQMAKQLGDFLVVAVNSDESIRKLKGKNRPVNSLDHRMRVLAGLGAVDWVVSFEDDTPNRLLKQFKPDILVKGDDYNLNQVVGADIVHSYGGEVRIMNVNINTSSSSIIEKMVQ